MNTQHLKAYDDGEYLRFASRAVVERDLRTLSGVLEGISCDQVINEAESHGLLNWAHGIKEHRHRQPYTEILKQIDAAIEDNVLTLDEVHDLSWLCNQYLSEANFYQERAAGIQSLVGLIRGITADGIITPAELSYLDRWLEENRWLQNSYPYDELHNLVTSILQDGKMDSEEQDALLRFCRSFDGSPAGGPSGGQDIASGLCQVDPSIIVPGRTFCLTGISKKYKRKEIAERIELFGGIVSGTVVKNLQSATSGTAAGPTPATDARWSRPLATGSRAPRWPSFMSLICMTRWKACSNHEFSFYRNRAIDD